METFEPLRGGGSEVFYLAQIDKNYAGKTMEINLWDPGDTGNLSAIAQGPGSQSGLVRLRALQLDRA